MCFEKRAFFAETRRSEELWGIAEALWERSGDIFARARHLHSQSPSVYKIREGFANADNDAIVKIAPLLSHKKMDRSSGKPVLVIIFAFVTGG